jgi:prephenate dehydrogenase
MDTLVVGAGEMGRWLARALVTDERREIELSLLDTARGRAKSAAKALDCTVVTPGTDESFDLVCVAVPIPATTKTIRQYAPNATRAMVDVTGTMRGPVDTMREHAPDRERVSLHPLFAPDNEPGNVPVVADQSGPVTDTVRDALAARDNTLFETTAQEHDELMETVQTKTHAAVLAFALASKGVPKRYQTPISAELCELADRVTAGDSRVYGDIQAAFDGADEVAHAAQQIADADRETFDELFDEARW